MAGCCFKVLLIRTLWVLVEDLLYTLHGLKRDGRRQDLS
jgi:hypothetical protein